MNLLLPILGLLKINNLRENFEKVVTAFMKKGSWFHQSKFVTGDANIIQTTLKKIPFNGDGTYSLFYIVSYFQSL